MVVDLILALRNLSLQLPLRQQRKKELSSTPLSVKKNSGLFPIWNGMYWFGASDNFEVWNDDDIKQNC